MYVVEGKESGFQHPASIYWTIVTLTTVGYGDISPETPLGQFIASFVMILGYGSLRCLLVSLLLKLQNPK
jgi:voltage-gated potassium channel